MGRALLLALCVEAASRAPRRRDCTGAEAEQAKNVFLAAGGLEVTRCPESKWLDDVANTPAAADGFSQCAVESATAMIVGGNKGFDCVGMWRLLAGTSGGQTPNKAAWMDALRAVVNRPGLFNGDQEYECGVCDQCHVADYPLPVAGLSRAPASPVVTCIEALPVNALFLRKAVEHLGWTEGLEIVHAAGTSAEKARRAPHLYFRTYGGPPGTGFALEWEAASDPSDPDFRPRKYAPVNATTVDRLVAGRKPPTILSVDTEGHDPLVLDGANATLASGGVAYVEFEYHNKGPWLHRHLRTVLDYMDYHGYDCWWAGLGDLYRLSGCWHDDYAMQRQWSNIVCAHRDYACWHSNLLGREVSYA